MMFVLFASALAAPSPADVVADMVTAWRHLTSYRCVQTIQERVDGDLLEPQRMRVTFRKPWEVQLTWETVHPGRQAYWSRSGPSPDVMVYPGGFTGRALGILTFSMSNPILKQDTRHTLEEAGFGYLAEKIGRIFAGGANAQALSLLREGGAGVTLAIGAVAGMEHGRAELTVDGRSDLPSAFASWDSQGALIERFSWSQVAIDVAIDPKVDFDVAYGR